VFLRVDIQPAPARHQNQKKKHVYEQSWPAIRRASGTNRTTHDPINGSGGVVRRSVSTIKSRGSLLSSPRHQWGALKIKNSFNNIAEQTPVNPGDQLTRMGKRDITQEWRWWGGEMQEQCVQKQYSNSWRARWVKEGFSLMEEMERRGTRQKQSRRELKKSGVENKDKRKKRGSVGKP